MQREPKTNGVVAARTLRRDRQAAPLAKAIARRK
jgi:hypothetical protein